VVPPYAPLRLKLDGQALVSNWRWLAGMSGAAACGAAIKADGYGLGASEVARRLAEVGCRDFFVATWAEAEAVLPAISNAASLSVLHGFSREDMARARNSRARPVLNTPTQVARWRKSGAGRPCDVMIDTGMNRLGSRLRMTCRDGLLDGLAIETLHSHLASPTKTCRSMPAARCARGAADRVPARRLSLANSAGHLPRTLITISI
jgi:alanine racemase